MAIPRVFVSSTCYDLKYTRENIKYFIRTLGYDPILSEEGAIFYDPKAHTHDACIAEVPNTQIFVLIIGGRFGGKFKDGDHSITNAEYREAIRHKIPVFTLVESNVFHDHNVYIKNKENSKIDETKIIYPSVDSVKIFQFIEEVKKSTVNNAIVPFNDFADIESYLKNQWAGMLYSFLIQSNELERVKDTFSEIKEINQKVEMLSKQILASVGTNIAKITVKFYEEMMKCQCIKDIIWFDLQPTPGLVVKHESYINLIESYGVDFRIDEKHGITRSSGTKITVTLSSSHLSGNEKEYKKLRDSLITQLKAVNISAKEYADKENLV